VTGDGEANGLQGRDALAVRGMSLAGERQLINAVQFFCPEGPGGWILDDDRLGMRLDDHSPVKRILLLVVQGKSLGISSFVRINLCISGNDQAVFAWATAPSADLLLDCSSGNIGNLLNPLAFLQSQGHSAQRILTHAVDDQIRRRICQYGAANRVRPVIIMGKTTQAGLDPAQDDGHSGKDGMNLVGVDNCRPIRPEKSTAGRIGIRAAAF